MSPVRIAFDPNQEHQNEAVASIVDLFEGLFRADTEVFDLSDEIVPNVPPYFQFEESWMLDNLQKVQRRNTLPETLNLEHENGFLVEGVSTDTWSYPTFTVDMETGTGKTYVYLRTIFELHKHYGLRKFVIVVPSVAIYEGVMKNLSMTKEHFKALYGNVNITPYPYDGSKPTSLRDFALGRSIEILVMTVDSFNKKSNVIYKKSDKLMGERCPYHFIQETRPILILDESQNYTSEKSRAALRTFKPLCAINYSATPGLNATNLVYKLSPFDAWRRNLVKKIEVLGMIEAQNTVHREDYLRLVSIDKRGKTITARFHLVVNSGGTLSDQELDIGTRTDVGVKTKNPAYTNWIVEEINVSEGFVSFTNGERVNLEEERVVSLSREALFRRQIEETIKIHLKKQEELAPMGVKILTLFFIDRVVNYTSEDGIIRMIFDETFERLKKTSPLFATRMAAEVQRGYFAKKKATKSEPGQFIDTAIDEGAKTAADLEAEKAAYELIMKNKEQLLSFDEPVSFIFAHSALREGWDNPNVFQICALREISSEKQRRQTIGRGLRLPVTQAGVRIMDRRLNTLTVIASESYTNYVAGLQREYADTGDVLPAIPANHAERETVKRNDLIYKSRDFLNFWNKLIQRVDYLIKIDVAEYIAKCIAKLDGTQYPEPHVVITRGEYVITNYEITLLEIQNGEAKILISRQDSLGRQDTSTNFYSNGADLAKESKNPVFRGFKIVMIEGDGSTGRVVFSEAGELRLDRKILFSTEQGQSFTSRSEKEAVTHLPKFNLIERAARELSITRDTVLRIFKGINRHAKEAFIKNPEGFAGVFIPVLREELAEHVADRIEYTISEDLLDLDASTVFPEEKDFPRKELVVGNGASSIYDFVQCDSDTEVKFVERLNDDGNVILYFKFPSTFKIRIPKLIGNYNPDWGILRWNEEHRLKLELVRETKGNSDLALLQHPNEGRKIRCARKHFGKIGVSYRHVTSETADWWKEENRGD